MLVTDLLPWLPQFAFWYSSWLLAQGGAAHSELVPPTPIINREHVCQTCLQPIAQCYGWTSKFLLSRSQSPSSHVTPACVTLTGNYPTKCLSLFSFSFYSELLSPICATPIYTWVWCLLITLSQIACVWDFSLKRSPLCLEATFLSCQESS